MNIQELIIMLESELNKNMNTNVTTIESAIKKLSGPSQEDRMVDIKQFCQNVMGMEDVVSDEDRKLLQDFIDTKLVEKV